ncbi:superoxide dismutase, Fe-Mn family [Chitinophaga terrae (ex Kim and Jung 2007)]|uniref:Superoxide dismutase n=1 Tax=Chitinophaga terrae (ex Kim and Jung 2007) TaxID=408074 RepID=A0A1H3Y937_9BACT|nr:superoxide dismutase [Chitinophaga terrae (ex Kim and Jung 2007)]GEP90871.1 superoxide dismutase [Chitinophaga terrae (ex Kim and Jung 2007)]SEA08116.1 superoxide dismutase, Fe-Mn family [Chitinophaga terrae (ex Kim and Jung 2007)]
MDKRAFLKLTGLAGAAIISGPLSSLAATGATSGVPAFKADPKAPFVLPPLPYGYEALEPHIDKLTMEIHHDKHHAAYVKNLNDNIANTPFANLTLEEIQHQVTEKDKAIRNNGGGHYNHSLFWTLLSPTKKTPSAKLKNAINGAFGSWEAFQTKFNDAAKSVFGSGWAWLIVTPDKKLAVTTTPNQDNPLMHNLVKDKGTPILALDVWEHAYYLKHQNKRPEYIEAFWNVVNWDEVEKLYNKA